MLDALAVNVKLAGAMAVALAAGLVRLTEGGTLAMTVTVTAADVFTAPVASVALAVMLYAPAATLFKVMLYGAAVAVPSKVVPL